MYISSFSSETLKWEDNNEEVEEEVKNNIPLLLTI